MYLWRIVKWVLRLGLLVTLVILALSACGGGEGGAVDDRPCAEGSSH
jgi:hypothetical protein